MNHSSQRRWDRSSPREPDMPLFAVGSRTSQAAASAVAPHRPRVRDLILAHLRQSGGATSEEFATALGCRRLSTVTARVCELVVEKLVADSGTTRPTSTKCQATVWIAMPLRSGG